MATDAICYVFSNHTYVKCKSRNKEWWSLKKIGSKENTFILDLHLGYFSENYDKI